MRVYYINVFISHSWTYSEHYEKLAEWVFLNKWDIGGRPIQFNNWSVPKDDPIHNAINDGELQEAIYSRIYNSDVILIPTGMYTNYSKWIKKEIEGSKYYGKKILAVNPWGQQKASQIVIQYSDQRAGWNKESIVKSVWELYNK